MNLKFPLPPPLPPRTNLSASPASKWSGGQVGDLPELVSFFDQMTGEQHSARRRLHVPE